MTKRDKKKPLKRRYNVKVSDDEASRLRNFDNKAEQRVVFPLNSKMRFDRRRNGIFISHDWTSIGHPGAYPTSTAKAKFISDNELEVTIRARGGWVGWMMIIIGLVVLSTVIRNAVFGLLLGIPLIAIGWFAFIARWTRVQPLDDLELMMRENIKGEWSEENNSPAGYHLIR